MTYDCLLEPIPIIFPVWHATCSKHGVLLKATIPTQGIFPQVATIVPYDRV